MKKEEFENNLKNKCHEYLYIKNDFKDCFIRECIGCVHKGNAFEIYLINKNKKYVFLKTDNNEEDAYDYLYEIFDILHTREINKLLDEYFECSFFEKDKYEEMIKFYIRNDFDFAEEFYKRKKATKKLKFKYNYKRGKNV